MACVMVVDDDRLSALLLEAMLRVDGHEVVIVSNGAEAIAEIDCDPSRISLVITDIFMPVMDGLELIRMIRSRNLSLPIIAVSAGSGQFVYDFLPAARMFGADEILNKPLPTTRLLTTVAEVLGDGPGCHSEGVG